MCEENFDFILARTRKIYPGPSDTDGFLLRRYNSGEADILKRPVTEVEVRTIEDFAKGNRALMWQGDRAFTYNGPAIYEATSSLDEMRIILPASQDDLLKFIDILPTD